MSLVCIAYCIWVFPMRALGLRRWRDRLRSLLPLLVLYVVVFGLVFLLVILPDLQRTP